MSDMSSKILFLLRWLYTLGFIICIPVILLRLLWKSRKLPAYRARILERFGIFKKPNREGGLWLHGVSVGESVAAIPIIRAFQKLYPNMPITVTTTTPTGSDRVQKTFGNQVFHVYFPYDVPWCFQNFLKRVRPKLCVIMETELWPNCLWICKQHNLPVIIANGRVSPASMKGYSRIRFMTKEMLKWITVVAAQSKIDGDRFIELGLQPNRLVIAGNVKFDVSLEEGVKSEGLKLREGFGKSRPVWVAASTHAGEEERVLAAFREIKKHFPDALLILVPRHPDRFNEVATVIQKQGYTMVSRSSGHAVTKDTAVFLGDTMGELALFYAASDVAFVGGSFIPLGGHNTLEPAALAVPVVVGPYTQNFVDITKLLLDAGVLVQVQDTEALIKAVLYWFNHPQERIAAGENGKKVMETNRGAVNKIMELIKDNSTRH